MFQTCSGPLAPDEREKQNSVPRESGAGMEVTKGVAGRAGLECTELTYGPIDSHSYYLKMCFVEDCSQIMTSGVHFPYTPECCSAH